MDSSSSIDWFPHLYASWDLVFKLVSAVIWLMLVGFSLWKKQFFIGGCYLLLGPLLYFTFFPPAILKSQKVEVIRILDESDESAEKVWVADEQLYDRVLEAEKPLRLQWESCKNPYGLSLHHIAGVRLEVNQSKKCESRGVTAFDYQVRLSYGDSLPILVTNAQSGQILLLDHTADTLLSRRLLSGSHQLKLGNLPVGRQALELFFSGDEGVNESQRFHIEVLPFESLRFLFLEGSPNEELKRLRALLGSMQHDVAVRTYLAPERYFDRLQNDAMPIQINAKLKERYDVLVLSNQVIAQLSSQEKNMIKALIDKNAFRAVFFHGNDEALGWIPNSLLPSYKRVNRKLRPEDWVHMKSDVSWNEEFFIAGEKKGSLPPVFDVKRVSQQSNWGFSSVQQAYQMQLSGEKELYRRLWVQFFNDLIPPNFHQLQWIRPSAALSSAKYIYGIGRDESLELIARKAEAKELPMQPKKIPLGDERLYLYALNQLEEGMEYELKSADGNALLYHYADDDLLSSLKLKRDRERFDTSFSSDFDNNQKVYETLDRKYLLFVIFILLFVIWIYPRIFNDH
ncbi:MAG: hypothetical protein LAT68_03515 [Cyclobacteriaceae bacterium]|nr:hypothetical protein [Cyclobacteriaceae bacterium]MCH8515377.1 hypothetical protein [Cyclobacteriaceae bacterium]